MLPKGVVSKPADRTGEHQRMVSQAMWTGRSLQAQQQREATRKVVLDKREADSCKHALRVSQQHKAIRKPGAKGTDLTTFAKLEIAFPKGPLRTHAAAAAHLKCSPDTISYTRRGLAELLLRDHDARTAAAAEALQRHLLAHARVGCLIELTSRM
jgi:hypothetical protein